MIENGNFLGQREEQKLSTGNPKNEKIMATKDRLYSEQRGRILGKEETLG